MISGSVIRSFTKAGVSPAAGTAKPRARFAATGLVESKLETKLDVALWEELRIDMEARSFL